MGARPLRGQRQSDEFFGGTMLTLSKRIHQAVWGAADVTCEECGRVVHAHDAIWRGPHPYCSAVHESADTGEVSVAVLSASHV